MNALVWFRRDLRDVDHAALATALRDARTVFCAFVFDREILDRLPSRRDRRVEFIHRSVSELDASLARRGGGLIVLHAHARTAIPALAAELRVQAVHASRDYEPDARDRDDEVMRRLAREGVAFVSGKDHVLFERDEITGRNGRPFVVFTPYWRAWQSALSPVALAPHASVHGRLAADPAKRPVPTLAELGFETTDLSALPVAAGMSGAQAQFERFVERIDRYHLERDRPAAAATSRLSVHARFGTISMRALASFAHARSLQPGGEGAQSWLREIAWRDFLAQLLWHHPRVATQPFRSEYDALTLPNDPAHFDAWRAGRTGYPIVDAGMRELLATGFMHNRVRMITASFLVKHLLVDWRLGERHFAQWLLDYDLASNSGNWQWAASTGCDAQPYFRIFNPELQSRRFDAAGDYIRHYVPELASLDGEEIHAPWRVPPAVQKAKGVVVGRDYPPPIVDHALARTRAIALWKDAARKTPKDAAA